MILDICTAFGFIPGFFSTQSQRFASNSGEDDWREAGWLDTGLSLYWVYPVILLRVQKSRKNHLGCKKTLNRNNGDIHYQTSTGEFTGFLVAINSSDH